MGRAQLGIIYHLTRHHIPEKLQTCDNLKLAESKFRLHVNNSRPLKSVLSHIQGVPVLHIPPGTLCISSPCFDIVLLTSILLSSYHTRVGLPRDFPSSLPNKILYAYLKRKLTLISYLSDSACCRFNWNECC